MSISDLIVVMKDGRVQQIGKPQEVYDDPANLFVAQFLGTPPINVFRGRIRGNSLFIGDEAVLNWGADEVFDGQASGEDTPVSVGIRPEGFIVNADGPFSCKLNAVEVMGRDVSVVCEHPELTSAPQIRAVIDADEQPDRSSETVRFSLKPHKVLLFDAENGSRLHTGW